MKLALTSIIVFIVLSFFVSVYCQDIEPLIATQYSDYIRTTKLLSNNNIAIIHIPRLHFDIFGQNSQPFSNGYEKFYNYAIDVNFNLSNIKLFDFNLDLLDSLVIESNVDSLNMAGSILNDTINNQLVVFIYNFNINTTGNFILLKTDYLLNPIDTLIVPFQEFNDLHLYEGSGVDNFLKIPFLNYNGNYIVQVKNNGIDQIFEIDQLGEVSAYNSDNWSISDKTFFNYSSQKYIQWNASSFMLYDSSFNYIDEIEISQLVDCFLDLPNTFCYIPSQNVFGNPIRPNGKEYIYFSLLFNEYDTDNIFEFNQMLLKVNDDLSIEYLYADTLSEYTFYDRRGESFDLVYEDFIYQGISEEWSFFLDPYQDYDTGYVQLRQFDATGALKWEKSLGGDASYKSNSVIATIDSGCIFIVDRYHFQENGFDEHDTYYIKFDKDGNVVNTTTSTGETTANINVYNILVYPNPTTDMLNFKGANLSEKTTANIYNMQGQLMLTENLGAKQIDVSCMPNGIYECIISNEEGILQSQEIIKQ